MFHAHKLSTSRARTTVGTAVGVLGVVRGRCRGGGN